MKSCDICENEGLLEILYDHPEVMDQTILLLCQVHLDSIERDIESITVCEIDPNHVVVLQEYGSEGIA